MTTTLNPSTEKIIKIGLQEKYPSSDLPKQFQTFVDEEEYDSDLIRQDIVDEDCHEILEYLLSENPSIHKEELNMILQEILNDIPVPLDHTDHCSMLIDPLDKRIVTAFVSKNYRDYKLDDIPLNIYTECILFYTDCFLELSKTENPTLLTILFATMKMHYPLQITGWHLCDYSKQCQYFSTSVRKSSDLIEKHFDFHNVSNDICSEIKQIMKSYKNISQSLLNTKHVNKWDDSDIIISIICYFTETLNVPQKDADILWSFIDQFRRFLYDHKFDGSMLSEYIIDYRNNYLQIMKDVCFNNRIPHSKYKNVYYLVKQWCENIIFQFGKTNNIYTNKSQKSLYSVMTTTQQFIYDKYESNLNMNANMLLISGYTKHYYYITNDVQKIIEQFYGKTYYVLCAPPKPNEFDYAIEIINPIKMIGINHNINVITKCTSSFAQKNIILNSRFLQINNIVTDGMKNSEEVSVIIAAAKKNGKSFFILRAKKELNQKGTHFMFDITLTERFATNKFQFHKFEPDKIVYLFKNVFRDNCIEMLHLYANRECLSGGVGVTVLLFVDEYMEISKYMLFKMNNLVQTRLGLEYNVNLSYTMKGLKGYGINTAWSNIPLTYWSKQKSMASLSYLVKGSDKGIAAWYYVFVDVDKLDGFSKALNDDIIHFENWGYILYSAYGSEPPQEITDKLKRIWKID